MRNKTNRSLLIGSILTVALALALGSPVLSQSGRPAEGKAMMEGKMMEHCRALIAEKQRLMADMKAQDAELTKEVAQMNTAPVDKKMNLMAAVITRMVEQRTSMNLRLEKMQEAMMQHMMQHVQMGKDSLSQCPMMQGMTGMNRKPAATRSEHPEHPK